MKDKKQVNIEQLESKLQSIGIDLTIIESLINLLDIALSTESEVKRSDLENLVIVMQRLIRIIISKHDKMENLLEM